MKRRYALVLLALALTVSLWGCAASQADISPEAALLEFPGTHWRDTPEQVIEELELTDDQILGSQVSNDSDTEWILAARDVPCFGADARFVRFEFCQSMDGGDYGLHGVWVFYPEEADMAAVQDNLTAYYGPGSEESPFPPAGKTVYTDADGSTEIATKPRPVSNHFRYWSVSTGALAETQWSGFLTYLEENVSDELRRAEIAQDTLSRPVITVTWSDEAFSENAVFNTDYMSSNCVRFSASMWVFFQQNFI